LAPIQVVNIAAVLLGDPGVHDGTSNNLEGSMRGMADGRHAVAARVLADLHDKAGRVLHACPDAADSHLRRNVVEATLFVATYLAIEALSENTVLGHKDEPAHSSPKFRRGVMSADASPETTRNFSGDDSGSSLFEPALSRAFAELGVPSRLQAILADNGLVRVRDFDGLTAADFAGSELKPLFVRKLLEQVVPAARAWRVSSPEIAIPAMLPGTAPAITAAEGLREWYESKLAGWQSSAHRQLSESQEGGQRQQLLQQRHAAADEAIGCRAGAIFRLDGAGDPRVNGYYKVVGEANGKPRYLKVCI